MDKDLFEGTTVCVGEQPEDVTIAFLWDPEEMTDTWEVENEEELIEMCTNKVILRSVCSLSIIYETI